MKQNSLVLNLRNFTNDDHPFGNVQGKETFRKLVDYIDAHPTCRIFGISLADIEATDASFPRESVISVAKHYREHKGIFLMQIKNRDILDNWNYAAIAKEQPLTVWNEDSYEILGPVLTSSSQELLEFVLVKKRVLASEVAAELKISVQNASTRLKKLVTQGYILRSEEVAESGGIEFIYQAIK